MRVILALLMAMSLALSPSPAFSVPSGNCSMAGPAHVMPADHEDMGCCTADCRVSCPSALLPQAGEDRSGGPFKSGPVAPAAAGIMDSVDPAGSDPPPRT